MITTFAIYFVSFLSVATLALAIGRDTQASRAERHHQPTHTDGQGYLTRGK